MKHWLAVSTLLLAATGPAWSQAEFFKDKEVKLLVGYAPGGGYDAYARVVSQFLGRHIPGHPSVVVQNMPGADGLALTNHMYVRAPKDGTTLALTNRFLTTAPTLGLIDPANVHYDPANLYWVANLNVEVSVLAANRDAGIKTIDELKTRQLVVGATGATSNNAVYPYVTNNLLQTKIKVVTGYPGTSHIVLAMERGEIQGIAGWAWSSVLLQKADAVRDHSIVMLLQYGLSRLPDLPDVPLIQDLASTDDERAALSLILAPEATGRPFFAPPGMPPERGGVLRAAFASLSADPEFKAAMEKAKLDMTFMDGDTLQKLVKDTNAASPRAIELAKRLTQRSNTVLENKQQ